MVMVEHTIIEHCSPMWLEGSPPGRLRGGWGGIIADMRLTEFHRLITDEFGRVRGNFIVHSHVPAGYSATVEELMAQGMALRSLWLLLCRDFDVPQGRHLGLDYGD